MFEHTRTCVCTNEVCVVVHCVQMGCCGCLAACDWTAFSEFRHNPAFICYLLMWSVHTFAVTEGDYYYYSYFTHTPSTAGAVFQPNLCVSCGYYDKYSSWLLLSHSLTLKCFCYLFRLNSQHAQ